MKSKKLLTHKTKGVYKLKSPNGKCYVGQSINLRRRMQRYGCLDCKHQKHLYNAIKKYGWENFEVEILYKTEKDFKHIHILLDTLEKAWIKKFDCIKNGYNLRSGGANGKISEATRKRMSEGQKRRDRTTPEEKLTIEKIGIANKKPINQYTKQGVFIRRWDGAVDIVKELGLSSGNISMVCRGKRKTTGGFIFKYGGKENE